MNHAFRLTRGSDLKKEIISYCQKKNIKDNFEKYMGEDGKTYIRRRE